MRWTIRRAEVWHGQGYKLVVSDTAWWALALSVTYDRLMDVLGHPCCGVASAGSARCATRPGG